MGVTYGDNAQPDSLVHRGGIKLNLSLIYDLKFRSDLSVNCIFAAQNKVA
jgi:hypothetical protein